MLCYAAPCRAVQAVGGIERLKDCVDSLIIIPNDQLLAEVQDRSTSLNDAFKLADTVLLQVRANSAHDAWQRTNVACAGVFLPAMCIREWLTGTIFRWQTCSAHVEQQHSINQPF